ncbi:MAG: peptide transporter ATP-binding protein [Verrucomicrobiota bacterium]|jgi:ABC-type dipeptide/oligopeptide/nickel transport system ATPase component
MSVAPLLKVRDLGVTFRTGDRVTVASTDVSFDLAAGEVLAVVGESGSGKSVSALALTRLLPPAPTCEVVGTIELAGRALTGLTEAELSKVRGKDIAYIFQEPGTSLNPVYTIGFQIGEAIELHRPDVADVRAAVLAALRDVHIDDPARVADSYPHELSGGMQQRAMIAMALACDPKILVADEPTTALDVTIQKEIMDLLARLRRERGMSILLITHNFGIVANFADHVQVMRKGRIVEQGPTAQVMGSPAHEYTKGLIACIPRLGQRRHRLTTLKDELKVS